MQGAVLKGVLGRFWFQMMRMMRIVHRAHHQAVNRFERKQNRWEPIVSAMSKKSGIRIAF